MTDQELIEKTRQGDSAAFAALWDRYERSVLALCRRFLAGPHRDPAIDEHDLAGDTCIRALHRLDRYEDRSAAGVGFESWLLEIARRLCLKFLAKQRRRQQWSAAWSEEYGDLSSEPAGPGAGAEGAPSPAQLVAEQETLRRAVEAINALPDLYRLPFKLFLEEHSQKEIAAALGISVESAAKRVQRARRRLRPQLAALFELGGPPPRVEAGLRQVEQALTEIVSDTRVVAITLPGGGEMQLCLRVDRNVASHATEIEARRARLAAQPRAWKQRLELAELCYHSGRWEEARQEYQMVLAIHPACFPAALRLGEMLRYERQGPAAAQVYRAALREPAPPALAAQLQAWLLAVEGNDEAAAAAFRRAIDLAPRQKASYSGLHAVLERLSRYEEQLENLARLRALDPNDLFALDAVYTPCARLSRFEIALPLLERAVALDPNYPPAVTHLFQIRMNRGWRDPETQRLAERLVSIAPELVDSWSQLAWFYAEVGRDEESLAVLRQFLCEHPHNAEAHAALAWRYHYLARAPEEVAHARRAYALEPQDRHICWTLLTACAPAFTLVGDPEAFQYAAEIAARFPTDAAVMLWLSRLHCARRREAEALACARRAVALRPTWVEAHAQLASVYRAFHRWEAAAAAYHSLVERPEGRRWLSEWGVALRALRDPRAEQAFATAAAERRAAGDYLGCAQIYEAWGRREEAVAAFRCCLSQSPLSTHLHLCAQAGLRRLGAAPDHP